jgi:hypothetical protein
MALPAGASPGALFASTVNALSILYGSWFEIMQFKVNNSVAGRDIPEAKTSMEFPAGETRPVSMLQ